MIGMVDSSAPKQFGELELKKGESKKGRSSKASPTAVTESPEPGGPDEEAPLSHPPANVRWLGLHLDLRG